MVTCKPTSGCMLEHPFTDLFHNLRSGILQVMQYQMRLVLTQHVRTVKLHLCGQSAGKYATRIPLNDYTPESLTQREGCDIV